MIYFDSSALVKRYVEEDGSDTVESILSDNEDVDIITSKLTYAEMHSAFKRKEREGNISEKQLNEGVNNFEEDWKQLLNVEIHDELLPVIKKVIHKYTLRGADAIHLSSALWFNKLVRTDVTFVASDKNLLKVAISEGLQAINPQEGTYKTCN